MKILRLCALVILLSADLHADEKPTPVQAATQRFREMLKTVDRIALVRGNFDVDPTGKASPPLPEIKGTDLIASLGETVELESFDGPCLCLTSPEIHFYQGNTYRFSMTLHHSSRLRCKDGPWDGDSVMTETSAARFRAWFAHHGYDGFVREYEMAKDWIKKQAEKETRLLSFFPESTRSLFSREEDYGKDREKKAAQLVAAFPNQKELLLTCWRGLGELQAWASQTRELHERLIVTAVQTASEQGLRDALAALPQDDSLAWLGAYEHCVSWSGEQDAIKKAVNDTWRARLAERSYRDGSENERWKIIRELGKKPGEESVRLLFKIAQSSEQPTPACTWKCTSPTEAFFVLAKLHRNEARPLIIKALNNTNTAEDKATLEVALALFDGPKLIHSEHLNCDASDVAKTAWQILSTAPDFDPSIEFLLLATNSKCYEARDAARALLRKRGLRPLSMSEQVEEALQTPRFSEAKTIPELDRIITEIQKEKGDQPQEELDQRILANLHYRRATLHLKEGEFEIARADLKCAYNEPAECADLAFILQTLGHFDEAEFSQSMGFRDETIGKIAAEYLERRAYLSFAQGWFESAAEDFHASTLLAYANKERRTIFRYLALLLAGKQTSFDIVSFDPHPGFGMADEIRYWPDTGLRLLQGKMTEIEVLGRIEKSRNKDSEALCEAHFVISVLRRVKGDAPGEKEHLLAALATKCYTSQSFSLATIRLRELETRATAKL